MSLFFESNLSRRRNLKPTNRNEPVTGFQIGKLFYSNFLLLPSLSACLPARVSCACMHAHDTRRAVCACFCLRFRRLQFFRIPSFFLLSWLLYSYDIYFKVRPISVRRLQYAALQSETSPLFRSLIAQKRDTKIGFVSMQKKFGLEKRLILEETDCLPGWSLA